MEQTTEAITAIRMQLPEGGDFLFGAPSTWEVIASKGRTALYAVADPRPGGFTPNIGVELTPEPFDPTETEVDPGSLISRWVPEGDPRLRVALLANDGAGPFGLTELHCWFERISARSAVTAHVTAISRTTDWPEVCSLFERCLAGSRFGDSEGNET
jgi:hypothetical protein